MGVTGLWKLIDASGKPVPLETLENKILAIDISIWLHQVVKGYQDSNGASLQNAHLLGLFNRLCKLLYYKIRPVFVFDGGMPELKRDTIRKRNLSNSKIHKEADRLQKLLLDSLAMENVVQQALGNKVSLLISPSKRDRRIENEKDSMFKLPPVPYPKTLNDSTASGSSTDLTSSGDDVQFRQRSYDKNINSINVTSKEFLDLPADIRHEILTDLKETRKQSSWGSLHELPTESLKFSSFQMDRLLKRRQIQVSLDKAKGEMDDVVNVSMSELETMLMEKGILDPSVEKAFKPIASNENMRYLLVKKLKNTAEQQAIESDSKNEVNDGESDKMVPNEESRSDTLDEINSVKRDLELSTIQEGPESADDLDTELSQNKCEDIVEVDEFDEENNEELQLAIQLSLGLPQMEQNKHQPLHEAIGPARSYLIEYAGIPLNDLMADDGKEGEIIELSDSESHCSTSDQNEPITLDSDGDQKMEEIIPISHQDQVESGGDISSDADSDLVEVPDLSEVDNGIESNIIYPMRTNPSPPVDLSKDFRLSDLKDHRVTEILIDPNKCKDDDDLFADIFSGNENETTNRNSQIKEKLETQTANIGDILINSDSTVAIADRKIAESSVINNSKIHLDEIHETHVAQAAFETITAVPNKKAIDILSDLESQLKDVSKITEDLNVMPDNKELSEIHLPNANREKGNMMESYLNVSPKQSIPSSPSTLGKSPAKPFFVNKSPSSGKKRTIPSNENESSKVVKSLFPTDSNQLVNQLNIPGTSSHTERFSEIDLETLATDLQKERRTLQMERNRQDRMGMTITERMSDDCMKLLQLFGVPYVVAPMEAEAQCAFLDAMDLTDGTITDDSDIWLFGGQTVYKHFFNHKKHVLEFRSDSIKQLYNVDRMRLIQLSVLVGSDYTTGISGVGAVTALEIIAQFNPMAKHSNIPDESKSLLECLTEFRKWFDNSSNNGNRKLRKKLKHINLTDDFPSIRVVDAYLNPEVDQSLEKFTWSLPDTVLIQEFAKSNFGWTHTKTEEILKPVLEKMNEKKSQQSILNYFKKQEHVLRTPQNINVSKRVKMAINKLTGNEADGPTAKKRSKSNKNTEKGEKESTKKLKRTKSMKDLAASEEPVNTVPATGLKKSISVKNVPSETGLNENVKVVNIPEDTSAIAIKRMRTRRFEELEKNKLRAINLIKGMKK